MSDSKLPRKADDSTTGKSTKKKTECGTKYNQMSVGKGFVVHDNKPGSAAGDAKGGPAKK